MVAFDMGNLGYSDKYLFRRMSLASGEISRKSLDIVRGYNINKISWIVVVAYKACLGLYEDLKQAIKQIFLTAEATLMRKHVKTDCIVHS